MSSAKAFELATGYISLSISTKGMGKEVVKSLAGADAAAKVAGNKAGKKFAKSFDDQTDDIGKRQAIAFDKMEKAAAASAKKVADAREKETAATNQLAIAQKKAQEAAERYGKESSQVASAAERVRIAEVKQTRAVDEAKRAVKDATDAHQKMKREYNDDIEANIDVDVSGVSKKKVQAEMGVLTRRREVTILPKLSKVAVAKVGAALGTLSGLTSIQKSFQSLQTSITNVFQNIPKIAAVATSVAGLSVMAGASAVNILSLGASLASIAPAALALPGILGGVAIGATTMVLAFKDAGKYIPDVGKKFQGLQKVISGNFWKQAEDPIRNLANSVLPTLRKGLGTTATELGGLFAALSKSFKNKLVPDLLPMFSNLGKAIAILKGETDGFAHTIATLGKRGSEYLPRLAAWFVKLTGQFDNFIQTADKNGDLKKWIDTGIEALKDLGRVASGVGGILGGVASAASKAGGSTLKTLADSLQGVSKFINSDEFQVSLVDAFDGLLQGAKKVTTIAGPAVKKMFSELGHTAGKLLPQIGTAFGSLIKGVADAIAAPGFQKGLLALGTGLADGLKAAAPYFTQIGNGIGALLDLLGTAAAGVLPLFAKILGAVGQFISDNKGPLSAIITAIIGLANTVWDVVKPLLPILTTIIHNLAPILLKLIGDIGKILTENGPQIKAIFDQVGRILNDFVLPLLKVVLPIATKILGFLFGQLLDGIQAVLTWLEGALDIVKGIFTGDTDLINKGAQKMFDGLKQYAKSFLTGWMKILTPLARMTGKIFGKLKDFVVEKLQALWRNTKSVVLSIFKYFKDRFTAIRTTVGTIVKKFVTSIQNKFKAFKDNLVAKVKGIWTSVTNWFRKIRDDIKTVVSKMVKVIQDKWKNFKDNLVAKAKALWTNVTDRFRAIRDDLKTIATKMVKAIQDKWANFKDNLEAKALAIWNYVTNKFRSIREDLKSIVAKMISAVQDKWTSFKNTISDTAKSLASAVTDRFRNLRTGVSNVFSSLVDGIKKTWEKLKAVVGQPIKATVDFVNQKLIKGGINWLLGKLGVKKEDQVPWIPAVTGFSSGGYTGKKPKDVIAGVVHGDEHVIKADSRRSVERTNPGLLDYINDVGMLPPGYAHGGMVSNDGGGTSKSKPKRVWPTNTRRLSPSYPGHSGVDIAAGMGAPIYAPEPGKITYTGTGHGFGNAIFEKFANGLSAVFGHGSKVLVKAGQAVTAGQQIGKVGSTGNSTGPHLHFEVNSPGAFGSSANRAQSLAYLRGATVGGSGATVGGGEIQSEPLWKKFIGKFADPMKWLSGKIVSGASKAISGLLGDNPLAKGLANVPKVIIDKAGDFISKKFDAFSGSDGASATWDGAKVSSLDGSQLNNAATIMATAKKLGFGERGALIGLMTAMQESTLRNLSGGDRDSVGLFQQRAPWGSFKDRTNPAKSAAMFYNGGNGGQPGLRSKDWKHLGLGQAAQAVQVSAFPGAYTKWEGLARQLVAKGYAGGTVSAARGTRWVGERGPELVNFKGGERVYNNADSLDLASRSGMKAEFNDCSFGADAREVAVELRREQRRQMNAVNLSGVA